MSIQNSSLKHPEITYEIFKAHSMLFEYCNQVNSLFGWDLSVNNLLEFITPIIEKDPSDDIKSCVLTALEITFKEQHAQHLTFLKKEWSKLSGLPIAASVTEAGWRKALNIKYKKNIDFDLIRALPGTPIANTTHQIMLTLTINFNLLTPKILEATNTSNNRLTFDDLLSHLNNKGYKDSKSFAFLIIGIESRKHINLVWHQANKLQNVFPSKSAAELLAYGWFGLRTALAKYDPSLGFAFSTYACTRITGSIRDGVRAESPIPKRLTTFARKVDAAEAYLTQELGRTPSLKEISNYLGEDQDKLYIMPRLAPEASIEEMMDYNSENGGFPQFLAENSDPASAVMDSFTRDALEEALAKLPAEEAQAIKLLVIDGLNPSRARELTGTTARQMRSRKDKGIALLKEYLGPWDPNIN